MKNISDVRPADPQDDFRDRALAHVVAGGDLSLRQLTSGIHRANDWDVCFGEPSERMAGADGVILRTDLRGVPALQHHVAIVLKTPPSEQMIGTHATPVVAVVADARRREPEGEQECDAVSAQRQINRALCRVKASVASDGRACPEPARRGFRDERLKPLHVDEVFSHA